MEREQYTHALADIEQRVKSSFPKITGQKIDYRSMRSLTKKEAIGHLLFMLPQMREFLIQDKREKCDRLLGFAQTYIQTFGIFSLEELQKMNIPIQEGFEK